MNAYHDVIILKLKSQIADKVQVRYENFFLQLSYTQGFYLMSLPLNPYRHLKVLLSV